MSNWTYTITSGYVYAHESLIGNATIIKDFLELYGFNQAAIIGIIANMEHESFLNPAQQEIGYHGDPSRGYGLVQWTPASAKILTYAADHSSDWYDGDVQMAYFIQSTGYSWIKTKKYPTSWNDYKNFSGDIYQATATFFYNFERGTWHDVLNEYAEFWNEALYGETPPIPPEPPTPPKPHPPIDDLAAVIIGLFMSKAIK